MNTKATINGKEYTIEPVFNMVLNWHFKDGLGSTYLVDAEDAQEWAQEEGIAWRGVETVIEYAQSFEGPFWWKEIPATNN